MKFDFLNNYMTLEEICAAASVTVPEKFISMSKDKMPLSFSTVRKQEGAVFFSFRHLSDEIRALRALNKGAKIIMSKEQLYFEDGSPMPCILIPNPEETYLNLIGQIKSKYHVKTIAITGSIGKTTVKEMIEIVSCDKFNTVVSKKNNNGLGAIGHFVQKLTPESQVYIQEAGAANPGMIECAATMLKPDAFLITNLGLNHIEAYGSQENILKDKLSIDKYLSDDGVVFVNYDDPSFKNLDLIHRQITFSAENPEADYFASDIKDGNGKITFLIHEGDNSYSCTLNVLGVHNVINAVSVFAMGRWLGIPGDEICKSLKKYKPEGIRQNYTNFGGQHVLVDCYNASKISTISAMDTLEKLDMPMGGRRIFVFADIEKLGSLSEEVHRQVGEAFASHEYIDELYCFGENAAFTAKSAEENGFSGKVFSALNREELIDLLKSTVTKKDVLLFKGGQKNMLTIAIDKVFGSSLVMYDGDMLTYLGTKFTKDDFSCIFIEGYGVNILRYTGNSTRVIIPTSIDGKEVCLIGKNAFFNCPVEDIIIGRGIYNIGYGAFFKCDKLKTVKLPNSLLMIEQSSFNGCTALEDIKIPKGATHIGPKAFYGCTNIKSIDIPASINYIDPTAFDKCPNLTVKVKKNSYGERFCRKRNINFKTSLF